MIASATDDEGLRHDGEVWYDNLKPIDTVVDCSLEAHILEDLKPCGHVRYYVELIDTQDPRPLYIGMFEQDHIAACVDLLQTADRFIRDYGDRG